MFRFRYVCMLIVFSRPVHPNNIIWLPINNQNYKPAYQRPIPRYVSPIDERWLICLHLLSWCTTLAQAKNIGIKLQVSGRFCEAKPGAKSLNVANWQPYDIGGGGLVIISMQTTVDFKEQTITNKFSIFVLRRTVIVIFS